ncbi:hypothetical protein FOB64_002855 [Candida albicans]|uniref:RRM domain-containing protein n=1 Tax=Candida albicans TaxID=5476 RepID=A0A8H6F4P0_CANAX|nr:hypothetical protein FOB64_002855 [Candida albicans]
MATIENNKESPIKDFRVYIGNISPKLKENEQSLTTRIAKYGIIKSPLEFHTKPLQLYYFAYVTISTTDSEFNKLKKSLNGVLFMGMKLIISLAKPNYLERWKKSNSKDKDKEGGRSNNNQIKQLEQLRRDKIVESRLEKIQEYKTNYPTNKFTSNLITCYNAGFNQPEISISEHTTNNISANTKNPPPKHRLIGSKSYGALTQPNKFNQNRFLYRSGKGIVIRGVHHLTWKYINGEWRSGDDHIIEKVTCGISSGQQAENYSKDNIIIDKEDNSGNKLSSIDNDNDNDNDKEEIDKNKSILASMFDSYDFDKPIELEETGNEIHGSGGKVATAAADDDDDDDDEIEVDSKGRKKAKHYDYEIEGKISEDEQEEEENDAEKINTVDIKSANQIIENYKQSSSFVPTKETYYDEDDEGNEIELDEFNNKYTTEAIKSNYDKDHNDIEVEREDNDDDEEEEFIPTFGAPKPNTNNTETLRALFNPTTSNTTIQPTSIADNGSFKLGLQDDDEDLDTDKQLDNLKQQELYKKLQKQRQEQQQQQQEEETNNQQLLSSNKKFGLFWCHFDSPFLSTQSQFSKLGGGGGNGKIKLPGEEEEEVEGKDDKDQDEDEESLYEKWFWSMRGDISRECKRRKRDLLRTIRKKKKN